VTAAPALLVTGPLKGGRFKIVAANRVTVYYVDVLGDNQKFGGSSSQRAACCTFMGAMDQESLALVGGGTSTVTG